MGLNLSNRQIARELDLNEDEVQAMTEQLRSGLIARTPAVMLDGTVEIDEVYVAAGHKGNPTAVTKKQVWTAPLPGMRPRSRHAGEGKATNPRLDPARR
jgi:hypothetical protein